MRTRAIVASLILALACSVAAGGCQVIAGLTVLQITGGTGGTGGAGGQGGAGGSSCVPCGNGQACVDSSQCQSNFCSKSGGDGTTGICKATKNLGLDCTLDEECGTGYCTDGVCCDVVDCGDACLSCASSSKGTCKPRIGATCDGACGDGTVTAGTCDSAGNCSGMTTTPCQSGAGCNPATLTCNTTCSTSAECSSNGFCAIGMGHCAPCGVAPPDATKCTPGQNGCDSCDANSNNTCVTTCTVPGDCDGAKTKTLMTMMGPARIECNGQCNGLTVVCQGPNPCDVVCDAGSCDGLILKCGPDGACNITCTGTGCTSGMGPTMNCGDNACKASCADGAAKVTQKCGGSCDCAKGTCL